ncbi:MAG: hypothetical protein ABR976_07885 [Terracidiphilus sp.]|jgi:hypothetical protein
MFGFRPRLPVTEDERLWVDEGFRRLSRMLGWSRMLNATVVIPSDEHFPDPYTPTEAGLEALFNRVCAFMRVPRNNVELSIIPDSGELAELLPAFTYKNEGPAGLHFGSQTEDERPLIAVRRSLLKDPLVAVATLAHELGHVVLLGGHHLQRDEEDMEPMTDLVTVYLGLGIFTANAARRFHQFQDDRRQGWSMNRLGYLPEPVFAYALARFAQQRGEEKPAWTAHLNTNLKTWFRDSTVWLNKDNQPIE